MKEGTYFGFCRQLQIHGSDPHGSECPYCGGMLVCCYRYVYSPLRKWVYKITPCHSCDKAGFDKALPLKQVQLAEHWVDLPEGQQTAMIDLEVLRYNEERQAARRRMVLAEQAMYPPSREIQEQVPEVTQDRP